MPLDYRSLSTIYNALRGEDIPTNPAVAEQQFVEESVKPVIEKTTVIVEQARDKLRGPLSDVLSGVAGIVKKAAPAALAACASKEYSGVRASFASFLQPVHIRSKYLLIGDNRHNTIGYPLEKYRTLNTLAGFTICQNVKLDFSGSTQPAQEEIAIIKQYLEAGCYIE